MQPFLGRDQVVIKMKKAINLKQTDSLNLNNLSISASKEQGISSPGNQKSDLLTMMNPSIEEGPTHR